MLLRSFFFLLMFCFLAACSSQSTKGPYELGPRIGKKLMIAYQLNSQGELNQAIEHLKRIDLERATEYEKALVEMTTGYMMITTPETSEGAEDYLASALARKALEPDKQNQTTLNLARLMSLNEQYQDASDLYRSYLSEVKEAKSRVYADYALAEYQLGNLDKATDLSTKLLEKGTPIPSTPVSLIIKSHLKESDRAAADELLLDLARQFPENKFVVRNQINEALLASLSDDQLIAMLDKKANVRTQNSDNGPVVRVAPRYPISAAANKIEGWVQLRFDVTKQGKVKNVEIINAQPKGVFETEASNALKKWIYKPKFEHGVAIERTGLTVQLDFKLG